MSFILTANELLQVVMDAAATTTESNARASFAAQNGSVGSASVTTTGTTAKTIVQASPNAQLSPGTAISGLVVKNLDSVPHEISIQTSLNSVVSPVVSVQVAAGYSLIYESGTGWSLVDSNGNFSGTVYAYQAGSWTVNVGNFPAVQPVSQSGTWSFSISGTVAVTQSGTWAVGLTGALPAGSNNIGSVNVATLPSLPAGSNVIGSVSVSNFPATQAVTGTFWQATQPVSIASLPSLAAGTNTIGAVTQASGPWSFNLTQVAGTTVATPTAYGTAPSSGNVLAVNANVTNTVAISDPSAPTTSAVVTFSSSSASSSFATSAAKHLCGMLVTAISVTSGVSGLTVKDGGGTVILDVVLPNFTSITNTQVYFLSGLALTMNNGSNAPTCNIGSGTITTGNIYVTLFYN